MMIMENQDDHEENGRMDLSKSFTCSPLWHKVDISNFQFHKNINLENNLVGLTIADDLQSKI